MQFLMEPLVCVIYEKNRLHEVRLSLKIKIAHILFIQGYTRIPLSYILKYTVQVSQITLITVLRLTILSLQLEELDLHLYMSKQLRKFKIIL